jgi:hypothetical protein
MRRLITSLCGAIEMLACMVAAVIPEIPYAVRRAWRD